MTTNALTAQGWWQTSLAVGIAVLLAACGAKQGPESRPSLAVTPSELLEPQGVRRLQEALQQRGLLDDGARGELDRATSDAVRRYQANEGLARTGFPDHATVSRLGLDPDEVYRSKGEADATRP